LDSHNLPVCYGCIYTNSDKLLDLMSDMKKEDITYVEFDGNDRFEFEESDDLREFFED